MTRTTKGNSVQFKNLQILSDLKASALRASALINAEALFSMVDAPREYSDRQTLWNAVEDAERNRNAQLAYSFDIAL